LSIFLSCARTISDVAEEEEEEEEEDLRKKIRADETRGQIFVTAGTIPDLAEEDLNKKIRADENRGQIFVTADTRKENHKFSEELFQDSAHYSHNTCVWLQIGHLLLRCF
jgi:hypothetical protein